LESSAAVNESAVPAATAPPKAAGINFILAVVFIDMLGVGIAIPVLPVLVGEFVDSRDLQSYWYGILATVFGLLQFVFMPALGALSDRVGRRPVMLYSMFGMMLNFLSTAMATSLAMLFIGRVLGGASSASMSVASAYASDVTTPENRAKTFGKIGAMFGLGFIVGPILGGMLGAINLHLPFYVAAGLSAANMVFGYFMVPESHPKEKRTPLTWSKVNPFAALFRLANRKDISGLIAVFALVSFAQVLLHATYVLYTSFRLGWGTKENGIALFCVGLTAAVVQAGLLGRLLKMFGEVKLAMIGLISGAVVYALYGLATTTWMMYLFILVNLLSYAAPPALQSIVSKATDPKEQGALMGSLQSIGSLATVVTPLIGATMLAKVSHLPPSDWRIGSVFFLCALLQTAACVIAWRFFRTHSAASPSVASQPATGGGH
jgi:DHA1 family tetracycline resistance protein-like MFS transporter